MDWLQALADRFPLVQTTLDMHGSGRNDEGAAHACFCALRQHRDAMLRELRRHGFVVPSAMLSWPSGRGVTREQAELLLALCLADIRLGQWLDELEARRAPDVAQAVRLHYHLSV